MFRKLRNKFIIINLVTTSLILLTSYTTIYFVARNSAESRKPIPTEIIVEDSEYDSEGAYLRRLVEERVIADRELALRNLLVTLLSTGLFVEVIVFILSYFFAEEAIKPVKDAYETQKIFIANASHEIKTPIAAIKANLEAADLSEENHWIKNIETEAGKIEALNLSLLKLAKTESIKEAVTSEPTNLKKVTEHSLKSFDSRIKQKGISLETAYKVDDKKPIKINRSDFQEILEILTDNAIKYCKKTISLTLTQKSLEIKNDGKTIPKEKLVHIFDRFYQVDKSSDGSGLGLAIADSLAKRNNWSLKAASEKNQTTFTLIFA